MEGQVAAAPNRVNPNLHRLVLSSLPPTGPSINLIAKSCCANLARDKGLPEACTLLCVCGNPRGTCTIPAPYGLDGDLSRTISPKLKTDNFS